MSGRLLFFAWALAGLTSFACAADPASEEFFEREIRPVLVGTCFKCHGDQRVAGGLRVDSRDGLLKGGESGAALEPGKVDASLLIQAIRRADDVSAMPPDKPLPKTQVAALEAWIAAGAPWPKATPRFEGTKHWAFEPVRRPEPPAVNDAAWVRSPLDRFILAKLEAAGMKPAAPADRRIWLRRVTYDLTGLPPSPEDVTAFLADASPTAQQKVVERLLESPHYGEHWGRHWLDVVRYADTAGENSDHPLPHAWRYRNWVIDAFNADLPYDEFLRDQIAGDLRAAAGPAEQAADRIVATGYLAIARRFGHDIDKDIHLTLEDTLDTLGKSVLGLTIGCCRCHDHKYDPLSTRDYYGLYGIFSSTKFAFPGCEPQQQPRDLTPLWSADEIERQSGPIRVELAKVDAELKTLGEQQAVLRTAWKDATAGSTRLLSSADVGEGLSLDLNVGATTGLNAIEVRKGQLLQLSILPRGNHGADSTRVEWQIAEAGGDGRKWSTADLVPDLLAGNPHADNYGHAGTWFFLDAKDGLALLPESVGQVNGRPELQAWRSGDTPSVFVNRSDQPSPVWTMLPAKSFFVHPGPGGPVAVAWRSPIDGMVTITGTVADAHPAGGLDGVAWRLEQIASEAAGETLTKLQTLEHQASILNKQRAELMARQPKTPLAYAVSEGTPANARIHNRGEPTNLGDEAPRKFLDVLGGQVVQQTASSGRLELADWLASPTNPLTARVMVNRIWLWHFGRGLVASPNDFGTRGTPPTHPELLDYLAGEFVKSGWSVKAIHRLILSSATYAESGQGGPELDALYGRFPGRRLTAEELRDSLLLVSGELDATPGGPHPFPPEETWAFSQHGPFAAEYDTPKRSVYLMQKRNRRSRFLMLFDGPDPNASTPVRDLTTVPTQALFFLNDPLLHGRADAFAGRVLAAADSDAKRLDAACQILYGRNASADEQRDAAEFLQAYGEPKAAWSALSRVLLSSNELLFVD